MLTKECSKKIQDYFKGLIEKEKHEVDVLECNAEIQRIIKEHEDGWIPFDEENKPPTDKYILLSFSNFSVPLVGRYEEDEEGGAFYIGDEDITLVSQDIIVNAWKWLPKCYND